MINIKGITALQRDFGLQLAEQLGTQGASGALGDVMGMLTQNQTNQNQIQQQQKLTDMQVKAQEQLGDYNLGNQMKFYNETGPQTQVNNLEKAGLNPALMYGAGAGGGGATTGAGAGSATGGQASQQSNAAMGILNAQQMQMGTAQLDNIKAQTRDTNADAAMKEGVQPKNIQADTDVKTQTLENLKATVKNTNAETALTQVETAAAKIQKDIAESTETDVMKTVSLNAENIQQTVLQMQNITDISDATKQTMIQTTKQTLANAIVQGAAIKVGIKVSEATIDKIAQEITASKTGLQQGQQGLTIDQQKANIQQMLSTSEAGLMDKEKSLLMAQTIIQGAGALGNVIKTIGSKGRSEVMPNKTTIHNYNAPNSY